MKGFMEPKDNSFDSISLFRKAPLKLHNRYCSILSTLLSKIYKLFRTSNENVCFFTVYNSILDTWIGYNIYYEFLINNFKKGKKTSS